MTDEEAVLTPEERTQLAAEIEGPVRDAIRPWRPRPWRTAWFWVTVLGVLLLLFGVVGAFVYAHEQTQDSNRRADQAVAAASSNAAGLNANAAALAQANARLRNLGAQPVPTPAPGARGLTGPAGRDATATDIAYAVSVYCAARSGCTGTPSQAQVVAAVTAYCAAGACKGATGATGPTGATGAAGASGAPGQKGDTGDTGPGPSANDIAAAVAAYCSAHGDCTGPAGPKGDTGATGATGRGITSVDCSGTGLTQLVINYDDGTTQTVPCTAPTSTDTPSPEPTP